jgi:hypothetical protein
MIVKERKLNYMKSYNTKLTTEESITSENPYDIFRSIVSDLNDGKFGLSKKEESVFADFLVNSMYIKDWIDGKHEILAIYTLEIITIE